MILKKILCFLNFFFLKAFAENSFEPNVKLIFERMEKSNSGCPLAFYLLASLDPKGELPFHLERRMQIFYATNVGNDETWPAVDSHSFWILYNSENASKHVFSMTRGMSGILKVRRSFILNDEFQKVLKKISPKCEFFTKQLKAAFAVENDSSNCTNIACIEGEQCFPGSFDGIFRVFHRDEPESLKTRNINQDLDRLFNDCDVGTSLTDSSLIIGISIFGIFLALAAFKLLTNWPNVEENRVSPLSAP